ncbi:hypothetical protein CLOP_g9218 [Closterium sp. NIES-67]|nr:hypothetical protein CLOP_g9218 [Closterium sp. NIES-67]
MASQHSLSPDETTAAKTSRPQDKQEADCNGSNDLNDSNVSTGFNGSPFVVLSYRQAARLVAISAMALVLLLAATFQLGRMSIRFDPVAVQKPASAAQKPASAFQQPASAVQKPASAVQKPAFMNIADSSAADSGSVGKIAAVDGYPLDEPPPLDAVPVNGIVTATIPPDTPRRRVLRSRGRPRPSKPAKKPAPAKSRAPAKKKPQAKVKAEVKAEVKEESKSGGDEKEVVVVPADQAAATEDAAKAAEAAAAAAAAAANGAGEGGGGASAAAAGDSGAAAAAAAAAATDSAAEPTLTAAAGAGNGESNASGASEGSPAATAEATPAAASDTSSSTSAAATSAPAESTSSPSDAAAAPARTIDPTTYYSAEGLERLRDPCGGIGGIGGSSDGSSSGDHWCYNRCHRRTRSGYCVKELLRLYDEAYSPLWPTRVDLLIRSYVSDNFFLTAFLFASIEQMWPAGIGDVILVLDENDRHVEDIVPPWVKIYYEKNYLGLVPKLVQQWSYLWADNYTRAPYVAIIDDDVIFNLKVTPGLLFNLTDGKPFIIGSQNMQGKNWRKASRYFVGPMNYFANFMVQLPFVFPRAVLPKFRDHVGALHRRRFGPSFDAAFKFWAERGPVADRSQIAHTTLGNYMWFFANDSAHWAFEWESRTPIPRVGVHIPHTHEFRNATGSSRAAQRLVKTYVDLTGTYAHEGLCNAFPEGELAHCEDASRAQSQIWRYSLSGSDWAIFQSGTVNGTVMHDDYMWELGCMYKRVVEAKTGEWKEDVEGKRRALVKELTRHCIVPHSNK